MPSIRCKSWLTNAKPLYLAEGSAYSSFLNDHEEELNLVGIEYNFHTDSPPQQRSSSTCPGPSHGCHTPLLSHTYPHLSHELLSVPPQNLQGVLHAPSPSASLSSHTLSPK